MLLPKRLSTTVALLLFVNSEFFVVASELELFFRLDKKNDTLRSRLLHSISI